MTLIAAVVVARADNSCVEKEIYLTPTVKDETVNDLPVVEHYLCVVGDVGPTEGVAEIVVVEESARLAKCEHLALVDLIEPAAHDVPVGVEWPW